MTRLANPDAAAVHSGEPLAGTFAGGTSLEIG
jgi:hypothetical protein